jgi:hypothetical protein
MRPIASEAPFEWFFALLMAASPIVGSLWVHPDITRLAVLSTGLATSLGVIIAGLRPAKRSQQ